MIKLINETNVPSNTVSVLTGAEKLAGNEQDIGFHNLVVKMNKQLIELTQNDRKRLFKVNAGSLPEVYLGAFIDPHRTSQK